MNLKATTLMLLTKFSSEPTEVPETMEHPEEFVSTDAHTENAVTNDVTVLRGSEMKRAGVENTIVDPTLLSPSAKKDEYCLLGTLQGIGNNYDKFPWEVSTTKAGNLKVWRRPIEFASDIWMHNLNSKSRLDFVNTNRFNAGMRQATSWAHFDELVCAEYGSWHKRAGTEPVHRGVVGG